MTINSVSRRLKPKFPMGEVVLTPNALESLDLEDIRAGLEKHGDCDWGDIYPEDRDQNASALWGGGRLFSVYYSRNGSKFWIITEADRRATTVLLPEDY